MNYIKSSFTMNSSKQSTFVLMSFFGIKKNKFVFNFAPFIFSTLILVPNANAYDLADYGIDYLLEPFNNLDTFEIFFFNDRKSMVCDICSVANVDSSADDENRTYLSDDSYAATSDGIILRDFANIDNDSEEHRVIPNPTSVLPLMNGILNLDGEGTWFPVSGFTGNDQLNYEICNSQIPKACDTAIDDLNVSLITGEVWEDLDYDGQYEIGEDPIEGVKVSLFDQVGNQLFSTFTGVDGVYEFIDVTPGEYYLHFTAPADFELTLPNVDSDLSDSDVDASNGSNTTMIITFMSDVAYGNIDAGYYKCANISGFVWYDLDCDAYRDSIENGINGVLVQVFKAGDTTLYDEVYTKLKHGTPSDDGYYEFCLPPGTYYAQISIPPQGLVLVRKDAQGVISLNDPNESTTDSDMHRISIVKSVSDNFNLTSGLILQDNIGAGFYPMATAGDLVWLDLNRNGKQDGGTEPPVENVVLEVYDADTGNKIDEDITDANGNYSIKYLQARDYFFKFIPPVSYSFTIPNQGGELEDSDVDSLAGNGYGTTRTYTINPKQDYVNIDAGLVFGVLPVDWLDVSVKRVGDKFNKILWSTAQEINASHFEIERSYIRGEWGSIGALEANGTTTSESAYIFDDNDAEKGGTYQYRIKQVDFDGAFEYSKTVSLSVEGDEEFEFYPNPSSGIVNLDVYVNGTTKFQVDVFDVQGILVLSKSINEEIEKGSHTRNIDLSKWSAGVYNFRLILNDKIINENVILIK